MHFVLSRAIQGVCNKPCINVTTALGLDLTDCVLLRAHCAKEWCSGSSRGLACQGKLSKENLKPLSNEVTALEGREKHRS